MELSNVKYEVNNGIATITLNRPAGLNPLSKEMLQDIRNIKELIHIELNKK